MFILLDDNLSIANACFLFERPVEIVRCDSPDTVEAAIRRIDQAIAAGLHAAGFFSYEMGYLFETRLASLLPRQRDQPLLWLGLFTEPQHLSSAEAAAWVRGRITSDYTLSNLRLSVDKQSYLKAFQRVREYIAAGDVYQVNLTLKYLFEFSGDPLALYYELRRKQRVAYGGVIQGEDFHTLSLSPELFLHIQGRTVDTRPMKGTAARAHTPEEDERRKRWLTTDIKSQAENLMIVDLLRNDLGRVAEIGLIRVTDLFTIETYRTVHQMTSGITARLRDDIGLRDLLYSLFPCGSVTGAPKIRAMEIINELEADPRGVYTGAIGTIGPNGNACFNVAIRTLMLHSDGRGEIGIGSGVVQDSDGEAEFDECLLKAHFLTRPYPHFQLIETLRWATREGYYLLDRHLDRLATSAVHFGYVCDPTAVRAQLNAEAMNFVRSAQSTLYQIRLLLDEDGVVRVTATPIDPPPPDRLWRYVVSEHRVDSTNIFLYHKTTNRALYDHEYNRLNAATGCDEVLFLNERGEITEGSRTNLFVERDGRLLTPAISCGLLDGTLRRELLERDIQPAEEAVLRPQDLRGYDHVFLGNSVQGLVLALPMATASRYWE